MVYTTTLFIIVHQIKLEKNKYIKSKIVHFQKFVYTRCSRRFWRYIVRAFKLTHQKSGRLLLQKSFYKHKHFRKREQCVANHLIIFSMILSCFLLIFMFYVVLVIFGLQVSFYVRLCRCFNKSLFLYICLFLVL